jgi:Mn-dependent DtxR family transcriptional regulator
MSVVKAVGMIERAGLPRTYRKLILLIDGQRSIGELAITMNCQPSEMKQMLQELERLTVIRVV